MRKPNIDNRFPSDLRRPKPDLEGKGEKGKRCNVNACQLPGSANHFNVVMCKWYCYHCAREIQAANPELRLFDEFYGVRRIKVRPVLQ